LRPFLVIFSLEAVEFVKASCLPGVPEASLSKRPRSRSCVLAVSSSSASVGSLISAVRAPTASSLTSRS
jgi:hypothetical protein